jgi:ribosomal subunit interface protein
MIKNIQIAGVHTKLTSDEEMYIDKKIGSLDRFIPRKSRDAAKVEVKLKGSKRKTAKDKFTCEVIFHLPHGSVTVTEKSSTQLAAIDQTENKLKIQLKKYKDKHSRPRIHRRLVNRFTRRNRPM